ncbi:L-threonine 3-dehydrogenase [Agromyces aerolatus]|uniref:L-threonine 3-dehydrogenase n=1 Tax=Agromyces sp. LY-1074 TaxID=3074080 RepID=UPI0028587FFC|nr:MULTISPECIES: L-threonine 3-dehydrogenase [unclassified Agromyces]MDR5698582.1 L-threonine 3-dehydrogenase [Agromyces sp. LY-1074]MDR5704876.1 L-threonine 3-dehydrogenase [Agromyces sp. LY-1358]
MKALQKGTAAPGLELVDRPMPVAGPDEVLVRVLRTGICGTDLHIDRWDAWAESTITAPLVPGHEFYGEVVEVGDLVHDVAIGDRVSGEGHIVCGTCRNCRAGRRQMCIRTIGLGLQRDGAFAEFLALPASNVWVHHPDVAPELGAIFDPLGNAVHTALMFPLVGEDVLVTGCGPIGLMAIAIARHVGARYIVGTDVSGSRLALAERLGASEVVDVSSTRIAAAQESLGMREGFDVGFEMSGAPTALPEMIENMNHGGRIAMLGLPADGFGVDWGKVVTHMLTIKGVYGREMFETWNAMGAMLQTSASLSAAVTSVISDCVPARDWRAGFAAASAADAGKIILDWTEL